MFSELWHHSILQKLQRIQNGPLEVLNAGIKGTFRKWQFFHQKFGWPYSGIKHKCYLHQEKELYYYPSIHPSLSSSYYYYCCCYCYYYYCYWQGVQHTCNKKRIHFNQNSCLYEFTGGKKAQPKLEDNISRVKWLRVRTSDEYCWEP